MRKAPRHNKVLIMLIVSIVPVIRALNSFGSANYPHPFRIGLGGCEKRGRNWRMETVFVNECRKGTNPNAEGVVFTFSTIRQFILHNRLFFRHSLPPIPIEFLLDLQGGED